MTKNNLYLNDIIAEVDNLPCSHPASVNIDVANFYYSLAKLIRPLLVVEIGCFIGFSTLHFAEALREQGFGKMISIDTFNWEVDAGNGMENRYQVALRYKKKAHLEDNLDYIKGFSTEVYSQIKDRIQNKIDLLYIDGDHTAQGVFRDFNTYYNDVRVGGFILLHDIYPEMCSEYGPRFLIDHLKSTNLIPKTIELVELPTRDGFGVSVLRKISNKSLSLQIPTAASSNNILHRAVRKLKSKSPIFRKISSINGYKGIQIQVLDKATGNPIPGACIICEQRWSEKRITDKDGLIFLDHYLPNRYQFLIEAKGYEKMKNFLCDVIHQADIQRFTVLLDRISDQYVPLNRSMNEF